MAEACIKTEFQKRQNSRETPKEELARALHLCRVKERVDLVFGIFGVAGCGKTTLRNCLFHIAKSEVKRKTTSFETGEPVSIPCDTADLYITCFDGPGFNDDNFPELTLVEPLKEYQRRLSWWNRNVSRRHGKPVLFSIYLLTHDRLNGNDLMAMKHLSRYGKVLLLMSKADCYHKKDVKKFQQRVKKKLQSHPEIDILHLRRPSGYCKDSAWYSWDDDEACLPVMGEDHLYFFGKEGVSALAAWEDTNISATLLIKESIFCDRQTVVSEWGSNANIVAPGFQGSEKLIEVAKRFSFLSYFSVYSWAIELLPFWWGNRGHILFLCAAFLIILTGVIFATDSISPY
mmetsp:Transcript_128071/g.190847  ORF Transcript_128071/g.190847 Transcript_128071/m.190847 type:complete len:345 (-) Transcript_128071:24-1058(-)